MDITIIIPTYNRAWALKRAIDSCLEQAGNLALQVVVVDDGSTDNTTEVLAAMPNIEVYKQQHWGKPWAVNMAFSRAKGKYIKFLDSDDWLVPNTLTTQFVLAEKENADVVVAGYQLHDEAGFKYEQPWIDCDDFIAQNLGECDSSHYSAFLFKRDFIKDIPHRTSFAAANFASRDDRCFMLEVALKEPKIAVMPSATLCHLNHSKGRLQFSPGLSAACTNVQHLLIYKNIIAQLSQSNRLTERRVNAAINILWPLTQWIAKDSIAEAAKTLAWIKELNPNFVVPDKGAMGLLYRSAGFNGASKLLGMRRFFKYGWR